MNIIGNPNVGKSTLMNTLVGENLSIITYKAQTTRQRIMGIVNGEDFQIVYSDTPGIVDPAYKLHERMMGFINTALEDADVLIFMVEIGEMTIKNQKVIDRINSIETPLLVLINKIDLGTQEKTIETAGFWQTVFPRAEVKAISALTNFNTEGILNKVISLLPEAPPYYPKDQLTDKFERFFAAEMIREKIFVNYAKEIPYSCETVIESFQEEENIIKIRSVIFVERDSQKGIVIGKGGEMLKKVGTQARKDMEEFFGKKVYLEVFVKVLKDWRNNENLLKRFGYTD